MSSLRSPCDIKGLLHSQPTSQLCAWLFYGKISLGIFHSNKRASPTQVSLLRAWLSIWLCRRCRQTLQEPHVLTTTESYRPRNCTKQMPAHPITRLTSRKRLGKLIPAVQGGQGATTSAAGCLPPLQMCCLSAALS